MKISVYLFKDEVESFDLALREDADPNSVEITYDFGIDTQAWSATSEPKPPRWASFLTGVLDVNSLYNYHTSLLFLAKQSGRIFAVTFGYASSLLRSEMLVPDFGLRVTANASNPNKIAEVSVRTISENSRQQVSRTTNRSSISEFGLEIESEWFRYLKSDAAEDFSLAKTLGGAQMLSLQTIASFQMKDIPKLLSVLFNYYISSDYKAKYPYLDNFIPINKHDPVINVLIANLKASINQGRNSHIGVLVPDEAIGQDIYSYKIYGDGRRDRTNLDEITSESLLEELRSSSSDDALEKLKILPLDDSEHAVRPRKSVYEYLVYEEDHEGAKYILCQGEWFSVSADYVHTVNERIKRIPDITDILKLPPWTSENGKKDGRWDEKTYNQSVADDNDWLFLDTTYFTGIGGPQQKIEACDLLTESYDFICIKRMNRSATLSHLFSQASVSATLYANETEKYRDKIIEIWKTNWPTHEPSKTPRMVIAIATDKPGPLSSSMFFFSKVNLLQHITSIRAGGFDPVLARIDYVT